MKKLTTASFAAIAMTAFAAPAMAADIVVPLTCNANNTVCTGAFNLAGIAGPNFAQGFTFGLPKTGKFGGSVTTEFSDPSSDIDFTSIKIDNTHDYTKNLSVLEPQERWDISNLQLAGGFHRIDITGNSGGFGSFAGTISFAAVPEPAAWGLMILGFGLIGGALRRRQKVAVRYA